MSESVYLRSVQEKDSLVERRMRYIERQRRLGHGDCGIYAEVVTGGTISDGEVIAAEQPELL